MRVGETGLRAHVSVWRSVESQEPTILRTGGGYDGVIDSLARAPGLLGG